MCVAGPRMIGSDKILDLKSIKYQSWTKGSSASGIFGLNRRRLQTGRVKQIVSEMITRATIERTYAIRNCASPPATYAG